MAANVFVTQRVPGPAVEMLRERFEVRYRDEEGALPAEQLRAAVAEVDGLLCLLTDKINQELLEAAPRLRIAANMAVGYDNIDVAAATRQKVAVTNTPGVLTETTADLAFALILGAMRRLGEAERYLREGRWQFWSATLLLGADVYGKTLGIVGMGAIGKAVARRAQGFAMPILYHNRSRDEAAEQELGARYVGLEELLREADVVSLHMPYKPETHHLINAERLRTMKPTAFLVNTARGSVVDEAALAEALHAGTIAGAGIDVFEHEPTIHPRLLEAPNALLVPHIGSASVETRSKMATTAAQNILALLSGERPPNLLNPEVWA
jgi:glyoxylate reductase